MVFVLTSSAGDFVPPSGIKAEVRGTKPDGNGFSYEARILGREVTVVITGQMTAAAGKVRSEIKQGKFPAADGSVGALMRFYAFIFLYSFPAMNTITAVHTAAQTSTDHSGTAPLWYNAGNVSISICRRTAIGRYIFFALMTP